jgi:hypothetical protein
LNSSLALVGWFVLENSLKWYLIPLYGGKKPVLHAYPTSTR